MPHNGMREDQVRVLNAIDSSGITVDAAALELVANCVAKPGFDAVVFDLVNDTFRIDHLSAFSEKLSEKPNCLSACSRIVRNTSAIIAKDYLKQYYHLDPLRSNANTLEPTSKRYWLLWMLAAELSDREYRYQCFDKHNIYERLTVLKFNNNGFSNINFYRDHGARPFSQNEHDQAIRLAALLMPILEIHSGTSRGLPTFGLSSKEHIRQRLMELGYGLTARELDVCVCAIGGLSIQGTALELQVGHHSIVTYRKRAYRKLGITSLTELIQKLV
jgi:DNA-binding CsgD family transcriptional regulator